MRYTKRKPIASQSEIIASKNNFQVCGLLKKLFPKAYETTS
jgi:hypothetical protein